MLNNIPSNNSLSSNFEFYGNHLLIPWSDKMTHSLLFLFSLLLRSSKMETSTNHHADKNLATFRLLYTVVQLIAWHLSSRWLFGFSSFLAAYLGQQHRIFNSIGIHFWWLLAWFSYTAIVNNQFTIWNRELFCMTMHFFLLHSDFGLSRFPICA